MKHANAIKKLAKQLQVEQKINDLYELIGIEIDNSYSVIKNEFEKLEIEVNEALGNMTEEKIIQVCDHYVRINEKLEYMFDITLRIENQFKTEIEDIMTIYVKAVSMFSESGIQEVTSKAFCFISRFRNELRNWIEDIITENAMVLFEVHKGLGDGLEYIFNSINEEDENNEELIEVVDKIKKSNRYIASARNLEKMALNNNYNFVRQSGSHKIYKHITTNKIVEIPFHTVDVPIGTSFAIQKRIKENAI